jgi:hypothetical protein
MPQRTLTVTVPSEALPEDGEMVTQESDELAVQSRFAVKVMVPLCPSALNSMLDGLVIVSSGAFWQDAKRSAEQSTNQRYLGVIIVVISVGYAPEALLKQKSVEHFSFI